MVTLRVRPHTLYTRTTYLARSRQLRWVHNPVLSWADEASHEAHLKLKTPNRELSLLEELFPEEVKKSPNRNNCANSKNDDLPRLPLPDIDDEQAQARAQRKLMTRAASAGAFRQSLMTVLLLSQASKTLVESDFRRIAPKGKHIEEWKGPGDILKGEVDVPKIGMMILISVIQSYLVEILRHWSLLAIISSSFPTQPMLEPIRITSYICTN